MKSFDQTFSKVCAGRGRAALVASAEAKLSKRHFYSRSELLVHFLCASGIKEKNGNGFLNVIFRGEAFHLPHLCVEENRGRGDSSPANDWSVS
jgi:hypothetical protein